VLFIARLRTIFATRNKTFRLLYHKSPKKYNSTSCNGLGGSKATPAPRSGLVLADDKICHFLRTFPACFPMQPLLPSLYILVVRRCFICKSEEHKARNCPKAQEEQKTGGNRSTPPDSNPTTAPLKCIPPVATELAPPIDSPAEMPATEAPKAELLLNIDFGNRP